MQQVQAVRDHLLGLQQSITSACTAIDGKPFLADAWEKAPGEPLQGNGITMILEDGAVFERAGCGFSHVTGPRLPGSARLSRRWAFRWCSIHAIRTRRRCT
jgi:coproporphyrinogen III oxidase